ATRLGRGDQPREVAVARLTLAVLLSDQGRNEDAIREGTRALEGLNDELAQAVLHVLAAVGARRLGFLDRSAAEFDNALDLFSKHLGKKHPYFAIVLYLSTYTLVKAKKPEQAAQRRQECLEIARETVGLGHPLAILPVQDQAEYLANNRAFAEGEGLYRE